MKKDRRQGFTLTELLVVLGILAILAAVAIPFAGNYIKRAEFQKNESNAKTVYLAAESMLTWYRTCGEWKEFRKEVVKHGFRNETFGVGDEREGRIYLITWNGKQDQEDQNPGKLVRRLLDDTTYDPGFFDGTIGIEIDIDSGQVYAAFYATRCRGLSYEENPSADIRTVSAAGSYRSYEARREVLLGYYSVEDVANVVELSPVRLKVTSIHLVNSETLSLDWSGNSRHNDLDVNYQITFYRAADDQALFSTVVNLSRLQSEGALAEQTAMLTLQDAAGNEIGGTHARWAFPFHYQASAGSKGKFSLTLDAMMSAELQAVLDAKTGADKTMVQQNYSTSITRLGDQIEELQTPTDLYARIQAQPTYENLDGDTREYRASTPARSNTENSLFATGTKLEGSILQAKITCFRHLSNIRCYDSQKEAVFTFSGQNMDWTAAGTGLYQLQTSKTDPSKQLLVWAAADGSTTAENGSNTLKDGSKTAKDKEGQALCFPTIPLLAKKHTLIGGGQQARIVHLRLGVHSVPTDEEIAKLYPASAAAQHETHYLGLFGEVEGALTDLTLKDPLLELTAASSGTGDATLGALYGVGILCGRSEGKLTQLTVQTSEKERPTLTAELEARDDLQLVLQDKDPYAAGIGGIVGVIAGTDALGQPVQLTSAADTVVSGLTMEGAVSGRLPEPGARPENPQERAVHYPYGIGGIFGYAWLGEAITVKDCKNHAKVEGNLFAGGIGGSLTGSYQVNAVGSSAADSGSGKPGAIVAGSLIPRTETPSIERCSNDGLVLCAMQAKREDEAHALTGRYFGGILGFGRNVQIKDAYSASGRASNYRYTLAEKDKTLLGQYVGGIIGYGSSCQLIGCNTKKGGYVLGSDYVGGIAGGLSNDTAEAIKGTEGVAVTTNASYVIGNSYVGGIVGKNEGTEAVITLKNCVNQGVAAGYGRYIGGIVGYNGVYGQVEDCASYLSDYSGDMFDQIVNQWQAAGDCVGGLAGYNNGTILFKNENQAITVGSVASLAVGRNYVGGMIGFNDADGKMEAEYDLIGGQVYAFGNGAGGCIGLNASKQLFDCSLTIQPGSVSGTYYVGGVIGANVVALQNDCSMNDVRARNSLGSIRGQAFTGGVIGYQRTYAPGQLLDANGAVCTISEYLLGVSDDPVPEEEQKLLPLLDEEHLPTPVLQSLNPYTFTLENKQNSAQQLEDSSNNMPIYAGLYAGGIVGACEEESRLVIRNCKNTGSIAPLASSDLGENVFVSLKRYLQQAGYEQAAAEAGDTAVSMVGGIISANQKKQIIDHCANTGGMSGFVGLGGIVSLNEGGIFNCALFDNFGNGALDYIGGIAGLNVGDTSAKLENSYTDVYGVVHTDWAGTIFGCQTQAGRTISGRSYVGGIVGMNFSGGSLKENENQAHVTAAGDFAGGLAGANRGQICVGAATSAADYRISASWGSGVGGVVGWNQNGGVVKVIADDDQAEAGAGAAAENAGGKEGSAKIEVGEALFAGAERAPSEVVAVGAGVSISGKEKVGGVVGIHEGSLTATEGCYLTSQASQVRASAGTAGGIAGEGSGEIVRAVNRCGRVTADRGYAGGIVAVNQQQVSLIECSSLGDVNSDRGYAGGIAAKNYGTIQACRVGAGGGQSPVTISSRGEEEIGAVCAVNYGKITDSGANGAARLSGEAKVVGGVVGRNLGEIRTTIQDYANAYMPEIEIRTAKLTVGGIAGVNEQTIADVKAQGISFYDFRNYRYVGGIAGENREEAAISGCTYEQGTIQEESSAAGNCYGGIVGINRGAVSDCSVKSVTLSMQGVYTATSTSTAEQKEALATHLGGVAGKNEADGSITGCLLSGEGSVIEARRGMAGGIAGSNQGEITLSGDAQTPSLMTSGSGWTVANVQELRSRAESNKIRADQAYVNWSNQNQVSLEELSYSGTAGKRVNQNRSLILRMTVNGNLGGITAYNAPAGTVRYCATGNWFLNNQSDALGVGTGGVIGMNESQKDLSFLLNRAFVGRQISTNQTNRFAGGIIGNQSNTTVDGWRISDCINYGTVYCLRTHYSGGIFGQWTGTGGTVERCINYGNLQTTYGTGWVGASGGIVAQLYHAYENHEYNIISCANYGNIYGRTGRSNENCANDSAGILGNITTYEAKSLAGAQSFTVQVLDCVNGAGVEIYSNSMASGIVGFLSCDNPTSRGPIGEATGNVFLRIERCRNFASILTGGGGNRFVGGIFGERYGAAGAEHTVLKNCYSVSPRYTSNGNGYYYNQGGFPISYMANYQSKENSKKMDARANYFFSDEGNQSSGYHSFALLSQNNYTVNQEEQRSLMDAASAFCLSDGTDDYLVRLENGTRVNSGTLKIAGDLVYSGTKAVGAVLFKIDKSKDSRTYRSLQAILDQGSGFDEHVRYSYHKVENAKNLTQGSVQLQMERPLAVTLTQNGSRLQLAVTPQEGCDPFKYTASLYCRQGDRIELLRENITFYAEDYEIELSRAEAGLGQELFVEVQACSMFEEVQPSDAVRSGEMQDLPGLPQPEVRIELMPAEEGQDAAGAYRYRVSLTNPQAFEGLTDWYISVRFLDGTEELRLEGTADGTAEEAFFERVTIPLQQLQVQAKSKNGTMLPSSLSSVPVYLPVYQPAIALDTAGGNGKAKPYVSVDGTNLDDLRITVTLDASGSGTVTTPPVYRVDLMGEWAQDMTAPGGEAASDVVLASTELLTASNGTAVAEFTNLPQYASQARNLWVRVWYAQSGLGPVYTYYPVEAENGNVTILEEMKEAPDEGQEETPVWSYLYSAVLNDGYFRNYRWNSARLITWLPRPKLYRVGELLTAEFDEKNELHYTLRWDQEDGAYKEGDRYLVSLKGINQEREVWIVSGREVAANELTLQAEDWSYESVTLMVTKIGSAADGTAGLTAEGTYPVGQRLAKPPQPEIKNPDPNELYYQVKWKILPLEGSLETAEQGCISYGIYGQVQQTDGTLGSPLLLGEVLVEEKQEDGSYQKRLNLESYAGERMRIYLVARADPDRPNYVDSIAGVTSEIQIPKRIEKPKVSWGKEWVYDRTQPVTSEAFTGGLDTETGSLTIHVKPEPDSIPPGDSGYLLKAYLFDTEEAAETAREAIEAGQEPEQLLTAYPSLDADGMVRPVQMEVNADGSYSHTMAGLSTQYAGKWILCYTRISSGSGQISSAWTDNSELWRLPYVKLLSPQMTVGNQERTVSVLSGANPDLLQPEEWTANHITLQFAGVEGADSYELLLTPKGEAQPQSLRIMEDPENGSVRVYLRTTDENGTEVWQPVEGAPAGEEAVQVFELVQYQLELKSVYTAAEIPYTYQITLNARLEVAWDQERGFSYTLLLPDVQQLTTANGTTVTDPGLMMTEFAAACSERKENLEGSGSEGYVRSDPCELSLGQRSSQ